MSLEEQIAQAVDPTVFVRLCNALLQTEHGHAYQVIDGTQGDDGNDGWLESQRRIFAIYCPVKPETRTTANYRTKALDDLAKAFVLRESEQYPVERWTFVTPRKLANEVIVEIGKTAQDYGIEANHVEATFLSGLLLKHRHLMKDFPEYHVSQLEEKLDRVLASAEVKKPQPSRRPEHDIFSHLAMKKIAEKDKRLKEIFDLRESSDPDAAKLTLRGLFYGSTEPLIQVNAVMGLMALLDPMKDDLADLASLCESARGAARRMESKSAEAYLLAQRGYYQSFEFGRLLVDRVMRLMMEQVSGFSLGGPAEQLEKKLKRLSDGYSDAFTGALELAKESKSGPATAAVLISIGTAAGLRAMTLMRTGHPAAFENDRDTCKRTLLAAKDIYAQLGEEYEVANVQMNLANQLRFIGEIEEAKLLLKAVIPIAEKHGDEDLLRKAKLLQERLLTGRIPNYTAGEKSGL